MSVGFPFYSEEINYHSNGTNSSQSLCGTNTIQPFNFKKINGRQFSDHRDIVHEQFRETSNSNLEKVGAVSSIMNGLALQAVINNQQVLMKKLDAMDNKLNTAAKD